MVVLFWVKPIIHFIICGSVILVKTIIEFLIGGSVIFVQPIIKFIVCGNVILVKPIIQFIITKQILMYLEAQQSLIKHNGYYLENLIHYKDNTKFSKQHKSTTNMW